MKTLNINSDYIGALSSILCLIHCMLTPVFFLFQADIWFLNNEYNFSWDLLNCLFLIVSILAVHRSIRNTSNDNIKRIMFILCTSLSLLILNEIFVIFLIPEFFIYILAISLALAHIYNLNYCRCDDDNCCSKTLRN